jgi:hypothetical protein
MFENKRDRFHLAVTDRRHGLHAEKKHVGERAGARVLDTAIEVITGGEQQVGDCEGGCDQADERGPRRRHEKMIKILESASRRAVNPAIAPKAADLHGSLRHRGGI